MLISPKNCNPRRTIEGLLINSSYSEGFWGSEGVFRGVPTEISTVSQFDVRYLVLVTSYRTRLFPLMFAASILFFPFPSPVLAFVLCFSLAMGSGGREHDSTSTRIYQYCTLYYSINRCSQKGGLFCPILRRGPVRPNNVRNIFRCARSAWAAGVLPTHHN